MKQASSPGAGTDLTLGFSTFSPKAGSARCDSATISPNSRSQFEYMFNLVLAGFLSGRAMSIYYNAGAPCDIYAVSLEN